MMKMSLPAWDHTCQTEVLHVPHLLWYIYGGLVHVWGRVCGKAVIFEQE